MVLLQVIWSKIVKKLRLTILFSGHFRDFFKVNFFDNFTSNEAQLLLKTLSRLKEVFLRLFSNNPLTNWPNLTIFGTSERILMNIGFYINEHGISN